MTLQGLLLRISPKHRLLLAAAAVVSLAAAAPGGQAALLARVVLALCALGGIAWWFHRAAKARAPVGGFSLALAEPQLQVLSRTGLSPKHGVALLQADGRRYLVVFGDGFAQVHDTREADARHEARAQAAVEVAS